MELHPIALGAIVAATITGAISFSGFIISKEQKTSEFRQNWIDSLRNEMSDLIGHLGVIVNAVYWHKKVKGINADVLLVESEIRNHMLAANTLQARIRLRLNPKEHSDLIGRLEDTHRYLEGKGGITIDGFQKYENALVESSQRILKKEWTRVKKGEPTFRVAKYIATFIVVAGFSVVCYSVLR